MRGLLNSTEKARESITLPLELNQADFNERAKRTTIFATFGPGEAWWGILFFVYPFPIDV